MARIPNGAKFNVDLPGGVATLTLREPTIEEMNTYHGRRLNVPVDATREQAALVYQEAQVELFDLLLTGVSGLEDDADKAIGPDRKHLIPKVWKTQAIFGRFDHSPVSLKN